MNLECRFLGPDEIGLFLDGERLDRPAEASLVELTLDASAREPGPWRLLAETGGRLRREAKTPIEVVETWRQGAPLKRELTLSTSGPAQRLGDLALRLPPLVLGAPGEWFYLIPDAFPPRRHTPDGQRSQRARHGVILHHPGRRFSLVAHSHDPVEASVTWVHERDGAVVLSSVFSTQGWLEPGVEQRVGGQWLIPVQGDLIAALAALRAHYAELAGGIRQPPAWARGPVLYAAHPAGSLEEMRHDLARPCADFARRLPELRERGFDALWLLPIYECEMPWPYRIWDYHEVEPGLGDEADCRAVVDAAHALDMRVLLDFVPHGPMPGADLAREHPEFVALDPEGRPQSRWGCLALDYAHPGYRAWLCELARDWMTRLDLDGLRVDCAEGGPPNWVPGLPYRASASGLGGGLALLADLATALRRRRPDAVLFPETDGDPRFLANGDWLLDQPFYRALCALPGYPDPTDWVADLAAWLRLQDDAAWPARFLENPDTAPARARFGARLLTPLAALLLFGRCVPLFHRGQAERLEAELERPLRLRRRYPVLRHGSQTIAEPPVPGLLLLERGEGRERVRVAINFLAEPQTLPGGVAPGFGWLLLGPDGERHSQGAAARAGESLIEADGRIVYRQGTAEWVWSGRRGGALLGLSRRGRRHLESCDLLAAPGLYPNAASQGADLAAELRIGPGPGVIAEGRLAGVGDTGFEHVRGAPPSLFRCVYDLSDPECVRVRIGLLSYCDAPGHFVHRLRIPAGMAWVLDVDGERVTGLGHLSRPGPATLYSGGAGGVALILPAGLERLELNPRPGGGTDLDLRLATAARGEPAVYEYRIRSDGIDA